MESDKPAAQQEGPTIETLNEHDVQLGRGAVVIKSDGNRKFRKLVLDNKDEYSSTGRHAIKDMVARRILDTIRERGGRFVRKVDGGWIAVNDQTSLNKVKQALREQEQPKKKGVKRKGAGHSPEATPPSGPSPRSTPPYGSSPRSTSPIRGSGISPAELSWAAATAAASAQSTQDEQPSPDRQDLAFRLKHPSLRKRDLSRMRREKKESSASSSPIPPSASRKSPPAPQDSLVSLRIMAGSHRTLASPPAISQEHKQDNKSPDEGDKKPKANEPAPNK